mgnify:CR=1 FL=1
MKRTVVLLIGVCLLGISAVCTAAGPNGRQVTDMVGRIVSVPTEARRLVTTFKPASLCVTALGLQDRLVGVDTDSKRDPLQLAVDPSIAKLPAVGRKSAGLNFEAILSVNPDLAILFAQKDGIAIADRLQNHGVAAIVILPEKIQALYDTLRLIASASGAPKQAERAISEYRRVVRLVEQRVATIADKHRKRVYFSSRRGIFSTATGDLLQDEMIAMAGAINVGHHLSGYFREISPEQFIAWNPDIILRSGHRLQDSQDILKQPQFAGVAAVANGRIHPFPSNIAHWDLPSPLSALGILWLAETCYPRLFADLDMTAEIDRFHLALFGKSFADLGGKLKRR